MTASTSVGTMLSDARRLLAEARQTRNRDTLTAAEQSVTCALATIRRTPDRDMGAAVASNAKRIAAIDLASDIQQLKRLLNGIEPGEES